MQDHKIYLLLPLHTIKEDNISQTCTLCFANDKFGGKKSSYNYVFRKIHMPLNFFWSVQLLGPTDGSTRGLELQKRVVPAGVLVRHIPLHHPLWLINDVPARHRWLVHYSRHLAKHHQSNYNEQLHTT